MTARIFATDVPLPAGRRPDIASLMPLPASSLDDALTKAARLFRAGAVVWRIETESQTFDEPGDIVAACQMRGLLPDS